MYKINEIRPLELDYLQISRCIDDLPAMFYSIGSLPTERMATVAIVGSRKPTAYGREVTQQLAGDLARRGVVIVSGLALGVDAIAHKAALDAGGTTIAVLANGLDKITPTTNRQLGERIIKEGGAIISEYPVGIPPLQHQFLARNRIVSGISDAVIVTEAGARSGTLNTAAHALSQGKDVFAVPGNITSPMSAGCNHLLRQGATAVTSVDDILSVIMPVAANDNQAPLPFGANDVEQAIIEALAKGQRDGDEILAHMSIEPGEFNTALTMLEINGIIKPLGANNWTLS
jgi:DNA processing protein